MRSQPVSDATGQQVTSEPEADPAFWAMIEERRPTIGRAELDDYLRERDAAAPPDPTP